MSVTTPATPPPAVAPDAVTAALTFGAGAYTLTCTGARHTVTTPAADADALRRDVAGALAAEGAAGHPHPMVVGVVPFDTTQPSRLFVPERTSWEVDEQAAAALPAPRRTRLLDRSGDSFKAGVTEAVSLIRAGALEKVVLSRTVEVTSDTGFDVPGIRERLRRLNGESFTFSVGLGQCSLVGASPELVAASQGELVQVCPLAGSAARGADAEEDERIVAALLASAKDRAEHRVVVEQVTADLVPVLTDLRAPETPAAYPNARLWHLGTRISGRLRPGRTSLDVALALHPTAAVCGHPSDVAGQVIARLEPHRRGAYAGLVGWMDVHGNGTWALALRCAEVRGCTATLFAGAGIVAGSDPSAELAETTHKLGTMLDALGTDVATEGAA